MPLLKNPFFLPQLILTHRFPFKLNGKVMQVLISIFLYHDFSVRNFIKGIQVHISLQVVQIIRGDHAQTSCFCLPTAGPAGAFLLWAAQRAVLSEEGSSAERDAAGLERLGENPDSAVIQEVLGR